jgi:aldehyde oxidoreductase
MALKKMLLNINGAEKIIVCEPEDRLSDVIRKLGLTGTKVGCEAGQCGACTILLDGKPVRSCVRKMKSIPERSEVTTIEGIGTPAGLHPLQLAWIVYGGVQCGFCSPGFIMSAKGLLDVNDNPTREEVRDWFQKHRNVCRCTGYKPLVDAVMAAAKVVRGEMTMQDLQFKIPENGRIYNTYYPRPAALAKVTGTCDFGADINLKLGADVLHAGLVNARVSHAKILSIDTSEAKTMPGVVKIITSENMPVNNLSFFPASTPRSKCNGFDRPFINPIGGKIYQYGDVCAIVVADTEKNARAAADKVKVEYEVLPAYLNALEAVAGDAIQIKEGIDNFFVEQPVFHGKDTKPIMDACDHVLEGSYSSQRQPHLVLEPDVNLAYIDDDGRLTIHCKCLAIDMMRVLMAMSFGMDPAKVRVIENPTGASFGSAISQHLPALAGIATLVVKRPVCLRLNMEQHMFLTGKRGPSFSNLKVGVDKNGKIQAAEWDILFDTGSNSELSSIVVTKGARYMFGGYRIPNAKATSRATFTNHAFQTAFRGFGGPQAETASEIMIDELAGKVGMDPLEFRYINVQHEGDETVNGDKPFEYPLPELIDAMRPKYKAAMERAKAESTGDIKKGVGVSVAVYNSSSGAGDQSEVRLRLNPDGTVTSINNWQDQGQGGDIGALVHTHEALRPLDLKPEQIKLQQNDTDNNTNTGPSAGSRSHFMNGNAIIDAANKLMDAMRKADGTYRTYDEMAAENIPTEYVGTFSSAGFTSHMDPNTGQGRDFGTYIYGFAMAEVAVDMKTGKTGVEKMTFNVDVGVVGSRQAVDGQMFGGIAQSIGLALSENFDDYKKHVTLIGAGIPQIKDIPDNIEVNYFENPRLHCPQGSAGCAELPLTGVHPSILNAIYNATGVRIRQLPATADKVKAGIDALKRGEDVSGMKWDMGIDFESHMENIRKNPIGTGGDGQLNL